MLLALFTYKMVDNTKLNKKMESGVVAYFLGKERVANTKIENLKINLELTSTMLLSRCFPQSLECDRHMSTFSSLVSQPLKNGSSTFVD